MAGPAAAVRPRVFRHSRWDALLVGLALGHGLGLFVWPSVALIGIGFWWNTNTIAHNFIHNPFFRSKGLNQLFSAGLTLLLGVPQTLWRDRHLAHHAGRSWRWRPSTRLHVELVLTALLWGTLAILAPSLFWTVYLPGLGLGLLLCGIHGYYEHPTGSTVGYHGWFYNLVFFNDGYHVEHHRWPARHWRRVASERLPAGRISTWPPVLRWLEVASLLDLLEKGVLRSRLLQRWVVGRHESALLRVFPELSEGARVGIVGGGLFPRTALILQRRFPGVRLTLIDAQEEHLEQAVHQLSHPVATIAAPFDPARHDGFDALIVPLAYRGDRSLFYDTPPAPTVLVHDWIWRWRGPGTIVSALLLKRLNRVDR